MVTAARHSWKRYRRFIRFSLRTFLVVVTIFCIWFGWHVNRAQQERRALEALWAVGVFGYDYEVDDRGNFSGGESWIPRPLRQSLGQDFFHDVTVVVLGETYFILNREASALSRWEVTDDHLAQLRFFPNLRVLRIQSRLEDRSIIRLAELRSVRSLTLRFSSPDDDAVRRLKALRPDLEIRALGYENLAAYVEPEALAFDTFTMQRYSHDWKRSPDVPPIMKATVP